MLHDIYSTISKIHKVDSIYDIWIQNETENINVLKNSVIGAYK